MRRPIGYHTSQNSKAFAHALAPITPGNANRPKGQKGGDDQKASPPHVQTGYFPLKEYLDFGGKIEKELHEGKSLAAIKREYDASGIKVYKSLRIYRTMQSVPYSTLMQVGRPHLESIRFAVLEELLRAWTSLNERNSGSRKPASAKRSNRRRKCNLQEVIVEPGALKIRVKGRKAPLLVAGMTYRELLAALYGDTKKSVFSSMLSLLQQWLHTATTFLGRAIRMLARSPRRTSDELVETPRQSLSDVASLPNEPGSESLLPEEPHQVTDVPELQEGV